MTFSPEEEIDSAFSKLSASVTTSIKDVNFCTLQRAAIEKANSPRMLQISNKTIPIINGAKSFQALCTVLAKSPYWNFLDNRMMEAMAAASLIPAAQQSVENFKRTFFGMTLAEAAPYFPIMPLKSAHTKMTEQLDKDPSKMTIFELHKHRFYLETELLQTGPDTITICRIVIGSVTITWQIHADHVYKAHCSLKKKQSQLPPQGIMALSVHEAEEYEGLPFVWRGQEIKQIGPIEPLPQQVQHKPIPLPEGLQWVPYDITSVMNNLFHNKMPSTSIRERTLWTDFHPLNPTVKENMSDFSEMKWSFAVKDKATDKIVGSMLWYLMYVQVGGKVLKMFRLLQLIPLSYRNVNLMYREVFRRVNLCSISQGLMFSNGECILKPVSTLTRWKYNFKDTYNLSLPHSPATPGWRAMTSKDIPSALALTDKYTSQFEIGQVFQSEEEFSHYFMCPVIGNFRHTYVVEDPVTGDVTDVAGFSLEQSMNGHELYAISTILVAVKSTARQLLIDLLVCAKQLKADDFVTLQYGLTSDVFEYLTMTPTNWYCHLLNYQYNEVDESQVCLFCF